MEINRHEFVELVDESMGHGDLEQLLTEIANKFMSVEGETETVQIDTLIPADVKKFAELLADYVVGPK